MNNSRANNTFWYPKKNCDIVAQIQKCKQFLLFLCMVLRFGNWVVIVLVHCSCRLSRAIESLVSRPIPLHSWIRKRRYNKLPPFPRTAVVEGVRIKRFHAEWHRQVITSEHRSGRMLLTKALKHAFFCYFISCCYTNGNSICNWKRIQEIVDN